MPSKRLILAFTAQPGDTRGVRAPASIFRTVSQSQAEPTSAGHTRTTILIPESGAAGPIQIFREDSWRASVIARRVGPGRRWWRSRAVPGWGRASRPVPAPRRAGTLRDGIRAP